MNQVIYSKTEEQLPDGGDSSSVFVLYTINKIMNFAVKK